MKRLPHIFSMLLLFLFITSQMPVSAQSLGEDSNNLIQQQRWAPSYFEPCTSHNDIIYAGVFGENGIMSTGMWLYDDIDIGEHYLKLELFYGSTMDSITNSAGYIETTDIALYPNHTQFSVPITGSYFWMSKITGTIFGDQEVNFSTYNFFPFNKLGDRYPDILSTISHKFVDYPESTAWQIDYREEWTAEDDAHYRASFEDLDWTQYKTYHMRPLKYGGAAHPDNMIVLTNAEYEWITRWWENY